MFSKKNEKCKKVKISTLGSIQTLALWFHDKLHSVRQESSLVKFPRIVQAQWKVTYQHTESTGVEPHFKSQLYHALTSGQVTDDLHWVQFSSMQNENNVQISELWEWKELTPWSAQNEWHMESEWLRETG